MRCGEIGSNAIRWGSSGNAHNLTTISEASRKVARLTSEVVPWPRRREQGLPFRFFSESRRLPETKFRPKFRRNSLIPNGKGLQIQKTKFRWIPTEISVISTEIRWFSTGKLCNLCFSYCSRGQMKNFWIPTLFSFSRSTTFVSGTFSFEQWFESYLIISKTTN